MANLWNNPNIPHKGWTNIDVIDTERADNKCEMCNKEDIRYVHIMQHPQHHNLSVGCICAEKMSDDYVTPRSLLERAQSRSSKYKQFLKNWQTDRDVDYRLYKGRDLFIIKKFGYYRYRIDHDLRPWSFKTKQQAISALFKRLLELGF